MLLAGLATTAQAQSGAAIAIIIDDLGDRYEAGRRVIDLPGALTYAFLPHTPYARYLAERAHRRGKEVMLHLPMQPVNPHQRMGQGGLVLDMSERALLDTLRRDLAAVPHVRGINNHMGSLLTRHPGHMAWLMQGIRQQAPGLYFVDSVTSRGSVAKQLANEYLVPTARRDVFLDADTKPAAIHRQFDRLLRLARKTGTAIGIAHPYSSTLAVLEERMEHLARTGVQLIPMSAMIERQKQWSPELWQASLSPSPKAAKSLKP